MATASSRKVTTTPGVVPGLVVLGVDPGITSPGLSVVRRKPNGGYEVLHHKVVRTKKGDSTKAPIHLRCRGLWDELESAVRKHRPALIVLEEQQGAQVGAQRRGDFNSNNGKTLVTVGVVIGIGYAYGVPLLGVTPQQSKIALLGKGNGSADKKTVQAAVRRLTGKDIPQDAADATAIAIFGHQRRGR